MASCAWTSWATWCQDQEVNPSSLDVGQLLNYLSHLYEDRGLSHSTIALHRSAVSTIMDPTSHRPIGAHPLVAQSFPDIDPAQRLRMLKPPEKRPVRMVLDTDTYNEIDDQFALVYALINFIGVIAVLRLIANGEFHSTGSESIDPAETDRG